MGAKTVIIQHCPPRTAELHFPERYAELKDGPWVEV